MTQLETRRLSCPHRVGVLQEIRREYTSQIQRTDRQFQYSKNITSGINWKTISMTDSTLRQSSSLSIQHSHDAANSPRRPFHRMLESQSETHDCCISANLSRRAVSTVTKQDTQYDFSLP